MATNLTRSGLVKRIAERHPDFTRKDVRVAVCLILDAIAESLKRGDRIEVRNFGSFGVRQRKAIIARNPKTGERVLTQDRNRPYFRSKMIFSVAAENDGGIGVLEKEVGTMRLPLNRHQEERL